MTGSHEVRGSNPLISTINISAHFQVGRFHFGDDIRRVR